MLITLYLSRVVLRILGIDDYGIYNAVGGVVVFFTVLDSAMNASCQRFMNYEMGKGSESGLKEVFCSSINIQAIISIIVFIITEILGMYLLYHYMTIPSERMTAAFWVFQFSAVTMIVNTLSIPYNALIIAEEHMSAFAYIDVLNTILKLLAVLLLPYINYDSLILYGLFLMLIQIITRFIYTTYCTRHFECARYKFGWNKTIMKKMLGFSFWTVFSSIATMLMTEGLTILYNRYYGVVANAAIGIATQVMMAVRRLAGNMAVSFAPQIVKRYTEGDYERVSLIWAIGTKCTFFLFALFSLPIILNADYILKIWLVNVPPFTTEFMCLLLLENLIRCFTGNAVTIVRATGNVKSYELLTNAIRLLFFVIVVLSFIFSSNMFLPYYIFILNTIFQIIYNVYIGCKYIDYSQRKYYLSNIMLTSLSILIVVLLCHLFVPNSTSVWGLTKNVLAAVLLLFPSFWFVGLLPSERLYLKATVTEIVKSKFGV